MHESILISHLNETKLIIINLLTGLLHTVVYHHRWKLDNDDDDDDRLFLNIIACNDRSAAKLEKFFVGAIIGRTISFVRAAT